MKVGNEFCAHLSYPGTLLWSDWGEEYAPPSPLQMDGDHLQQQFHGTVNREIPWEQKTQDQWQV